MDNYTLKADKNNIKETLLNNSLDRKKYVIGIANCINQADGNLILSLEGDWGTGKTFVVKQLEAIFNDEELKFEWINTQGKDVADKINLNDARVLYYDAWENDGSDDPLLNIVYNLAVMSGLKINSKKLTINKGKVISDLWDLTKNLHPAFGVVDFIKNYLVVEKTSGSKINDVIGSETELKNTIRSFITEIKDKNKKNKLVIVIDELDRCRPEFALKLLESLKHYFYEKGIIVILSINTKEIHSIINKYYGNEIDANLYLEKIIDTRIQLSNVPAETYLNHIFKNEVTEAVIPRAVRMIADKYRLSLRQINRYIGELRLLMPEDVIYGKITRIEYFSRGYLGFFAYSYLIPYLIGIRLFCYSDYLKIKNGENEEMFVNDYFTDENAKLRLKLRFVFPELSIPEFDDDKNSNETEAVRRIYRIGFSHLACLNEIDESIQNSVQKAIEMCELLATN